MGSAKPTVRELVESLTAQGLVHPSKAGEIAAHVGSPSRPDRLPMLLQFFIGSGAWFAAMFFIAALAIARLITEGTESLFIWGFLFLAGSIILRRLTSHVFPSQFSLALGVAGQTLTLVGVAFQSHSLFGVAIASMVLSTLFYFLHPDLLLRFGSVVTSGVLMAAALIDSDFDHGLHALVGLEALAVAVLFTRPHLKPGLLPVAFGLAAAMLVNLWMMATTGLVVETADWASRPVMALWLVAIIAWAAGGMKECRREAVIAALLAALGVGLLSTPGIAAAIGLLILGYARANRTLLGFGLAALPVLLVTFYYDLDIDLQTKSLLLMASGVILLGARFLLARRPWAREAIR